MSDEHASATTRIEIPAKVKGEDVTLLVDWNPFGALVGGEFHLVDIRAVDGTLLLDAARQAFVDGARTPEDVMRMAAEGWRPSHDQEQP